MARLRTRSRICEKRKIKFSTVKRKTVSQKVMESESFLMILLVSFMCIASVSYIFQTNNIATKGYEVQQYQDTLDNLKSENQDMKSQEAQLRSIKNLEAEKTRLSSISSSDIDYVTPGSSAVAMR